MMIENHLRHIKPLEFNRSVIWASRAALILLILVAIVAIIPILTGRVQFNNLKYQSWQWKDSHTKIVNKDAITLEFIDEVLVRVISPQGGYISNGESSFVLALNSSLGNHVFLADTGYAAIASAEVFKQ